MSINPISLTLRDLEYVVAVADQMHFGKAAERVHVSQPTLSAQIKKTEGLLGVTLFERTQRKVALTPLGHELVQQARVVLDEARKLGQLAQGKQDPMSGTLRLGAIATLGPYFLPHLLSPLRKMHPKLNLLLTEGLTDGLLKQLREGELDAVLASPTFAPEGFRVVPLFFEPFLLAAPPKHALSEKDTLRATDLKTEEMVLLEDGHCLKDQAVEFCPANRRGSYRRYHATSLETLRHLVAAGHGYTLFPALAVEMAHNSLKNLVIYRPFTGKAVGRPIVLVCREKYARMAQIDELAQLIQKNLPPGVWAHAV